MELVFRTLQEPRPGPQLEAVLRAFWPDYCTWFLSRGDAARPPLAACRAALVQHMPELVPTWEELGELLGEGELGARMLSLWCPSPYLAACTQLVLTEPEPLLVRNYDYAPELCDAVLLSSAWSGRRTLVSTDCMWGALDGMNADGLACALAFGGRNVIGEGFGIPLVLRYVLETCATVADATRVLERVPVHMAYNVSFVDAAGDFATVYVGPDRPAIVRRAPISANHQLRVEWEAYDAKVASRERELFLARRANDPAETADSLVARFLEPPLLKRDWAGQSATIYTAVYRPTRGEMELRWPGERRAFALGQVDRESFVVSYGAARVD